MERTILTTENYNDNWKLLGVGWIGLVVVVSFVFGLGFWGTFSGLSGLAFAYWALRSVVRMRSSRTVATSSIAAVSGRSEAVQVVGHAQPIGEPLTAPFTGERCVAYKLEIQEPSFLVDFKLTETGRKRMRALKHTDGQFQPFVVDDGTGVVYVDPSNAEVVLTKDDEIAADSQKHAPEAVREYLERESIGHGVGDFRKQWYSESRLDVDDEVRIVGRADPDTVPDLEQPVTTAIVGADDTPEFFVTDDPEFGLDRQLRQQALGYGLVAAILIGVSYWLLFVG